MGSVDTVTKIFLPVNSKETKFTPFSGKGYILGSSHPMSIDTKPPTKSTLGQNESKIPKLLSNLGNDVNGYLDNLKNSLCDLKSAVESSHDIVTGQAPNSIIQSHGDYIAIDVDSN